MNVAEETREPSQELVIPQCGYPDCDSLSLEGKAFCEEHSDKPVRKPKIATTTGCKITGCESPLLPGKKYCAEHQALLEEKKKKEVSQQRVNDFKENDFLVREAKIRAEAEKIRRKAEHDEAVIAFDPMGVLDPNSIVEAIRIKAESVQNRLPFIGAKDGEFTRRVPFYNGNLILIGAQTGHGKTTVMAAIANRLIQEGYLPLIMTNETSRHEFFVALACLSLKTSYRRYSQFTPERLLEIETEIKRLVPMVRVIDQLSVPGGTSSVTGLKTILDKIVGASQKPAAVLLDYLQGISEGIGSGDQSFEIQHDASEVLWSFILKANIPIVVFSQLHPKDKQRNSLEDRIKLGKHILTRVTYAMEYMPQYKDMKSGESYEEPRAVWRPWKYREMEKAEDMDPFHTLFNNGHFGEPERLEDLLLKKMLADEEKPSGKTDD